MLPRFSRSLRATGGFTAKAAFYGDSWLYLCAAKDGGAGMHGWWGVAGANENGPCEKDTDRVSQSFSRRDAWLSPFARLRWKPAALSRPCRPVDPFGARPHGHGIFSFSTVRLGNVKY
jgi:hypothetical protein